MQKFAFMLKTYRGDLGFATRLLASFHEYNHDGLPLYIVIPENDLPVFRRFEGKTVSLIPEESIPCKLALPSLIPRESGYINQQVIKLAFHRLGITENYMCLDSDGVFIRQFTIEDFIHEDGLPYQVLVEDKLLQTDQDYVDNYWDSREHLLEGISSYLQIDPSKNLKTCHGFQIFQSKVLERFENEILFGRGPGEYGIKEGFDADFLELITLYGLEFSWYNYYLQKTEPIIHEVEPLFLYVHSGRQLVELQLFRTSNHDLARSFVGVVVNGNFQHFSWEATLHDKRILNAAAYVGIADLLRMTGRFGAAFFLRTLFFPLALARRFLIRNRLR